MERMKLTEKEKEQILKNGAEAMSRIIERMSIEMGELEEENKNLKEKNEKLEEDNINLMSFNERYSPDVIVKYEDRYEIAYNEECIENARLCDKMRRLEEENKKLKDEVKDLVERNIELDKKYMLVLTENRKLKNYINLIEGTVRFKDV